MRRLFLVISILLLGAGSLWSQSVVIGRRNNGMDSSAIERIKQRLEGQISEQQVARQQARISVVALANGYLSSYYGQTDFSAPQWVRVHNFMQWLADNEERLNNQFHSDVKNLWDTLSEDKKEVALGTWLGMKYALDQVGRRPQDSFPIELSQEIWENPCADYAKAGKIYCSRGNFVTKVNIGLHEAIHLLPNAHDSQRGYMYGELYAVAGQVRYGLPVKNGALFSEGTRSFFAAYHNARSIELLAEYTAGIAALIDYDDIWQSKWRPSIEYHPEVLGVRVGIEIALSKDRSLQREEPLFSYSPVAEKYFETTGKVIGRKYCTERFPKHGNVRELAQYMDQCFEEHPDEILQIVAENLRPLVSPNIPPVPKGYM